MVQDPEIKAMAEVAAAIGELEPEARRRVLKWALDRYRPASGTVMEDRDDHETGPDETSPHRPAGGFADFPALFDAANPDSAAEKALVAGYWFQVIQGEEDFDGFRLNKELKHLGHPSTNITRDLDSLINRSPRLVIQTRKLGSTKQARKQYKLTREGIKAVERMLSQGGND